VRLLAGALLASLLSFACSSQWHGEPQAFADFSSIGPTTPYYGVGRGDDVLVLPAASRPSISRRISLLPKILAIEREMAAPMVSFVCGAGCYAIAVSFWRGSNALSAVVFAASLILRGWDSRFSCEVSCSAMAVLYSECNARDVGLSSEGLLWARGFREGGCRS
jgi:hypothetical protein